MDDHFCDFRDTSAKEVVKEFIKKVSENPDYLNAKKKAIKWQNEHIDLLMAP